MEDLLKFKQAQVEALQNELTKAKELLKEALEILEKVKQENQ
jgi:hypothetical protein